MSVLAYNALKEQNTNEILLNGVGLTTLGNILITDLSVSPPELKTSEIDPEGRHGSIDTTYSIYPDVRYKDRYVNISCLAFGNSRQEVLDIVKAIDNYILGQELKIKRSLTAPFYFSGRAEKGVEYEFSSIGIANISLTFRVFPLSILNYDTDFLWDDIVFADYWFDEFNYNVAGGGTETATIHVLTDVDEVRVYCSADGLVANDFLMLKGLNYLPVSTVDGVVTIFLDNPTASNIEVNLSTNEGRLEYA